MPLRRAKIFRQNTLRCVNLILRHIIASKFYIAMSAEFSDETYAAIHYCDEYRVFRDLIAS